MKEAYSFIANSSIMAILAGLAISFAMVQSVIFFKIGYKRAIELGFTVSDIKKIVKGSAIFSIIPSIPIIISYMVLLPTLGKFFPWLRLSVIGSATYETMVANMAVTSYGFEGLGSAELTPEVYGSIMWVVTLGLILSSLSVLLLKKYDGKMKQLNANKNSFGAMVGPIMFLGMMATFAAPYLVNFSNPISMITIAVSAGSMILLDKISQNHKSLKEFTFSLSMIFGMASASLATIIIGG